MRYSGRPTKAVALSWVAPVRPPPTPSLLWQKAAGVSTLPSPSQSPGSECRRGQSHVRFASCQELDQAPRDNPATASSTRSLGGRRGGLFAGILDELTAPAINGWGSTRAAVPGGCAMASPSGTRREARQATGGGIACRAGDGTLEVVLRGFRALAVTTHHRRASGLCGVDADLPGPELDCGISIPKSDGSQSGMAPGREATSDASLVPRSRTCSAVQPTAMPNARPAANASPAPTVSTRCTGTAAASR